MTYSEFGRVIGWLISKLEKYQRDNQIKFDIVVPILRSGGISGMIVAIQLGITKVLPVQFKYCYKPIILKQLLSIPRMLQTTAPKPNILIIENHTSTGDTAKAVIDIIEKYFPDSTLYYATVMKEHKSPTNFDGIKEYFYGQLNDEDNLLSPNQQISLNVRPKILVFPWENIDEVVQEVNNVILEEIQEQS